MVINAVSNDAVNPLPPVLTRLRYGCYCYQRRKSCGGLSVKRGAVAAALVLSLLGFAAPSVAQKGGRGGGGGGSTGPLGVPSNGTGTAGNKVKDFVYGVIKAVNKDEMVLTKTNAGVDETFKFTKKTKFIRDGKNSSLESLKLGDQVWVDANEDKKSGDFIARKVVSGAFLM
jgi:hypothetical protein